MHILNSAILACIRAFIGHGVKLSFMVIRRRKKPSAPIAVAYLRVSTDEQDLGLEVQRAAIEAWAAREGVEVIAWHEEKIDGGTELEDRAALPLALAELKARRASRLVAYRLDRLARDPLTSLLVAREVERAKAQIVYVVGGGAATADPTAKLLRTVLLGVAEFEKDMIGARTRAALAVKRSKGDALGAPGRERYGFTRGADGKLVPHPEEQTTIAMARELYATLGVSERKVLALLEAEGRRNRHGKPFNRAALAGMLKG